MVSQNIMSFLVFWVLIGMVGRVLLYFEPHAIFNHFDAKEIN